MNIHMFVACLLALSGTGTLLAGFLALAYSTESKCKETMEQEFAKEQRQLKFARCLLAIFIFALLIKSLLPAPGVV